MSHDDGGEGTIAYAMYDKSYDRMHDALSEYSWGYRAAGSVKDVTERYVSRNFTGCINECRRAFSLMDTITEERLETAESDIVSNFNLLLYKLSYYFYSYVKADKPYPRNFLGEALGFILAKRDNYERALYEISSMSREAVDIFEKAAEINGCDKKLAKLYSYECENYLCLAEDWLAILKMYDLTKSREYDNIAYFAHERYEARIKLMEHCEEVKDKYSREALTMRNHSIFMQMFADIENYIKNTEKPQFDLLNASPIFSKKFFELR